MFNCNKKRKKKIKQIIPTLNHDRNNGNKNKCNFRITETKFITNIF